MSVSLNHYFFLQGNVSGGSSKVISDRVRHKRLPWGGGGARILNGMAQLIPKYILKHQQQHFIETDCYKLVIYLPANS